MPGFILFLLQRNNLVLITSTLRGFDLFIERADVLLQRFDLPRHGPILHASRFTKHIKLRTLGGSAYTRNTLLFFCNTRTFLSTRSKLVIRFRKLLDKVGVLIALLKLGQRFLCPTLLLHRQRVVLVNLAFGSFIQLALGFFELGKALFQIIKVLRALTKRCSLGSLGINRGLSLRKFFRTPRLFFPSQCCTGTLDSRNRGRPQRTHKTFLRSLCSYALKRGHISTRTL